jgi:uncharacterized protein YndB with AHSA1/START domain
MSAAETIFRVEPDQPVTVLTRHFDAPPELVFETYTDPEMVGSGRSLHRRRSDGGQDGGRVAFYSA